MSLLKSTPAPPTAPDPLVATLLQVALFNGLSLMQLQRLAADAERRIFHAHEVLTKAGTPADAAFLIVAGPAVHVPHSSDDGPGQTVVPGSLIGEMGMLIEHTYGATVVARGPVRALRLTRAALHAHMLDDPTLAEHLMQQVAQRLMHVAAELRRVDDALQQSAARVDEASHWAPSGTSPARRLADQRNYAQSRDSSGSLPIRH